MLPASKPLGYCTTIICPCPTAAQRLFRIMRIGAHLIRQVYEVDPLLCPQCGGTMKVIAVIEPACALHADRRPAVTCLPAGRSGRSSTTWASPPQCRISARHPTHQMPWPLSSRASGPTNRSLTTFPCPIHCSSRPGRWTGLLHLAPFSLKIRKKCLGA